ncbi:hypothetical protein CL656_05410 [bacterium]|nr:hypothetical protein [bacterium]
MEEIQQVKLTREEWEFIEKPCNSNDKYILQLLINAYNDIDMVIYKNITVNSYLKINDKTYDEYIFENIFKPHILLMEKKYEKILSLNKQFTSCKDLFKDKKNKNKNKNIKKSIIIKIDSSIKKINSQFEIAIKEIKNKQNINNKNSIIEFNLFVLGFKVLYNLKHRKTYNVELYSYLIKRTILKYQQFECNANFMEWFKNIMYYVDENINIDSIMTNYKDFVINNYDKSEKIELYTHQKELISHYKNKIKYYQKEEHQNEKKRGSLIFYSSPTGTGKTMTPICLLKDYKIIFICAARHVGLSLANYMITMGKKVAFAFGCSQMEDIRLHNNAINSYTEIKNKNKIYKKPDHSNGEKVEIIISDIQSYYYSMLYMLSFNEKDDLILYWDEPTISLDYNSHELHGDIVNIMENNKINNLILSSATLPKISEVRPFINNFISRFSESEIDVLQINSDIFQNNVGIYDTFGNSIMPHNLWLNNNTKLSRFIDYFTKNKKLQKYLDIEKCIEFIMDTSKLLRNNILNNDYVKNNILPSNFVLIENKHITEIYIYLLSSINNDNKSILNDHFITKNKLNSKTQQQQQQVFLTSTDSYTITGGPCLYLTNNYKQLMQVLFKTSQIPETIIDGLLQTMQNNEKHLELINKNVKLFEDIMEKEFEKEKKMNDGKLTPQAQKIKQLIDSTQNKIKSVSLENVYIPNYREHFEKFHNKLNCTDFDLWSSRIDEVQLQNILTIEGLEPILKIMLMIGIGVLHPDLPSEYNEIMKELSKNQQLFMIIAQDDYIYGTNYQFCHGYLGKDLNTMTQEKLIQSMGRIGRQSFNKIYSFRLRDNSLIEKIYFETNNKIEVNNMNKLFVV